MMSIFAMASSIMYILITYQDDSPIILNDWFNSLDRILCTSMSILYVITLYIKQLRFEYLTSAESLMQIAIFMPIMLSDDLSMLNPYYILIGMSRFIRIVLFCQVMRKQYNDFGDSEVSRHIFKIIFLSTSSIVMLSGIFIEIENS